MSCFLPRLSKFPIDGKCSKHLLSDLQPYSCLIDIDNCPLTKEAFPTRNDYLKHLKLDHKLDSQTPPMVCPLCRETTESGMPGIAKHLANHLEDIAIAASPLDIDSEEDSDADSSKAQGGKGEGSPLPTITEDTEDKPITRPYLSHEGVFIAPNCAICNAPVIGEDQDCGCEERQLKIAFEQSEHRIFAVKLKDAR